MKKKFFMAALLVGSLLVTTSCLDDNESSSVEAIRKAKAAQLEALAAYSSAQAQALLLGAEADAAMKAAEVEAMKIQNQLDELELQLKEIDIKLKEIELQKEEVSLEMDKVALEQRELELKKQQLAYEEAKEASEIAIQKLIAELELWQIKLEEKMYTAKKELNNAKYAYNESLDKLTEQEQAVLGKLFNTYAEANSSYLQVQLRLAHATNRLLAYQTRISAANEERQVKYDAVIAEISAESGILSELYSELAALESDIENNDLVTAQGLLAELDAKYEKANIAFAAANEELIKHQEIINNSAYMEILKSMNNYYVYGNVRVRDGYTYTESLKYTYGLIAFPEWGSNAAYNLVVSLQQGLLTYGEGVRLYTAGLTDYEKYYSAEDGIFLDYFYYIDYAGYYSDILNQNFDAVIKKMKDDVADAQTIYDDALLAYQTRQNVLDDATANYEQALATREQAQEDLTAAYETRDEAQITRDEAQQEFNNDPSEDNQIALTEAQQALDAAIEAIVEAQDALQAAYEAVPVAEEYLSFANRWVEYIALERAENRLEALESLKSDLARFEYDYASLLSEQEIFQSNLADLTEASKTWKAADIANAEAYHAYMVQQYKVNYIFNYTNAYQDRQALQLAANNVAQDINASENRLAILESMKDELESQEDQAENVDLVTYMQGNIDQLQVELEVRQKEVEVAKTALDAVMAE